MCPAKRGNYTLQNMLLDGDQPSSVVQLTTANGGSYQTQNLIGDGRGNLELVTDNGGGAVCTIRYDFYGNVQSGQSSANPCYAGSQISRLGYGFAQKETNTGDYQLGSRVYDPSKDEFLTPDLFQPGSTQADVSIGTDPLTRDRYVALNSDPVNLVDPSGHNPCSTEGVGADGCTTQENGTLAAGSAPGAGLSGPVTPWPTTGGGHTAGTAPPGAGVTPNSGHRGPNGGYVPPTPPPVQSPSQPVGCDQGT